MDIIFSLDKINEAASEFINATKSHKVFLFEAEMGAGKTTFIKEVCILLGVKENISSPTFSIINEYRTDENEVIYHLDLYRLEDEEEARQAGVEECIHSGNICFIEWPNKAPGLMPDDAVHVSISILDDDKRKLSVQKV